MAGGRRISVTRAAGRLGVDPSTVRRMIDREELVSAKRRSGRKRSWRTLDSDEVERVAIERGQECAT